jgi:hypothetical protein
MTLTPRKRSECNCGCHRLKGIIHFVACCEPDEQPKCEPVEPG